MAIDKIYIEDEKFPGFITKLSKDRSFYTILEKDYNIQPKHAVLEIDGIIAQNQHADLLKCNIGDPLFSINKIVMTLKISQFIIHQQLSDATEQLTSFIQTTPT